MDSNRKAIAFKLPKGRANLLFRRDKENSSLAFLDMDLGYRAVLEIGQALRMLNPEIRLVIFSGEGTPPRLDELRPWMFSPNHTFYRMC